MTNSQTWWKNSRREKKKNAFSWCSMQENSTGTVWQYNFAITTSSIFLASGHAGDEVYCVEGEKEKTNIIFFFFSIASQRCSNVQHGVNPLDS